MDKMQKISMWKSVIVGAGYVLTFIGCFYFFIGLCFIYIRFATPNIGAKGNISAPFGVSGIGYGLSRVAKN